MPCQEFINIYVIKLMNKGAKHKKLSFNIYSIAYGLKKNITRPLGDILPNPHKHASQRRHLEGKHVSRLTVTLERQSKYLCMVRTVTHVRTNIFVIL